MELSSSLALGILADDCRSLREDARHAAAAVVGMRDTYCSFQAEVVGQDTDLAPEEGSKKTTSASEVLPSAATMSESGFTTAASVTPL